MPLMMPVSMVQLRCGAVRSVLSAFNRWSSHCWRRSSSALGVEDAERNGLRCQSRLEFPAVALVPLVELQRPLGSLGGGRPVKFVCREDRHEETGRSRGSGGQSSLVWEGCRGCSLVKDLER